MPVFQSICTHSIIILVAQQIHLEAEAEVRVLEVLQAGLKSEVPPKHGIEPQDEFVARIFGYGPGLGEESRTEGNAPHQTVPFGVILAIELPVGQRNAKLVARKDKVFGGGHIPVEEIELDVAPVFVEGRRAEIVTADGHRGVVASFLQGSDFYRYRTVFAVIIPQLFVGSALAFCTHIAELDPTERGQRQVVIVGVIALFI